jgi:alanyl-tRNA synthetase
MSNRLYYTDAYRTAFDAEVTAVDGPRVHLAQTAFYPTSGGQPFDTGVLGGSRIIDVVDEADEVVHILEAAPAFSAGATVHGTIDWPRRFDHMQQHTGQHVLSAVFEDLIGAKTVSVHFGAQSATLDLDTETVTRAEAARVEARANTVIAENRVVSVSFEDAATATGLRKPSDRTGEIRIVSIADLDRSACGGTHVRATGEIGGLLVRRLEKYKKNTRVEFLCGARAIARARADYEALTGMAAALSAGIDELPALVAAQSEAIRSADSERRKLAEALAAFRARDLYEAASPDAAGLRRIMLLDTAVDDLRAIAHAVSAMPRAVFVGTCATPATVVHAASKDAGVNAGAELKAALTAVGGRGGGNPTIAQGTVPTAEALATVASLLAKTS